jgi:hypothetical protein
MNLSNSIEAAFYADKQEEAIMLEAQETTADTAEALKRRPMSVSSRCYTS